MNNVFKFLMTPWGLAVTAIVILGGFAWWVLTSQHIQSEYTVRHVVLHRLAIVLLLAVCAGLGVMAFQCGNPASTAKSERQFEVTVATNAPTKAVTPAPCPTITTNSNKLLRILLWLNISLALPWITAFATRHVLAKRSNALSFALLTGYTAADIIMVMLIGGVAFAGLWGISLLVGILIIFAGYNYWACETVARLWGDVSAPRRRSRG